MPPMIDVSSTIIPKSDQLNAEDFITGPRVVTVAGIKILDGEQPMVILLAGGFRPFKPCKTMRRLLVTAWGADGAAWIGKSMRLYRDPSISFGDQKEIGGIRISHLSHIPGRLVAKLTTTRGRRSPIEVNPLDPRDIPPESVVETARMVAKSAISRGWTKDEIKAAMRGADKIEDMTPEQIGTFLRDLMHPPGTISQPAETGGEE